MRTGRYGEDLAVEHLKSQGYKILERNFRARYAEIDIIARDDDILAFVEVKTRVSERCGSPEEGITHWKLRTLKKAAEYYKLLHPELPDALRIDLVGVELNSDRSVKRLSLTKDITGS